MAPKRTRFQKAHQTARKRCPNGCVNCKSRDEQLEQLEQLVGDAPHRPAAVPGAVRARQLRPPPGRQAAIGPNSSRRDPRLWMGCDRDDRDLAGRRTVAPENTVRAGRAILGVGFEDLVVRVEGMLERTELVSLQAWMPGVLR